MIVVLALCAAGAYGLSDFFGGLYSRRASPWLIAVVAQAVSVVAAAGAATVAGGRPTLVDLGLGALSGIGSGVGTYYLYRGLGSGAMNVVAPLSAIGAAILPVLVGVATGERPGLLPWLGIACALPAIWLVAAGPGGDAARDAAARAARTNGVRDGLAAGAGFGLLFIALGHVRDDAGLWPVTTGQAVATALLLAGSLAAGVKLRTAARSIVAGAVLVGVLAGAAAVLYQIAVRGGLVSITAVLTSLYPAVTVLLAALVLSERMGRLQAIGLALAAGAVVLVAVG